MQAGRRDDVPDGNDAVTAEDKQHEQQHKSQVAQQVDTAAFKGPCFVSFTPNGREQAKQIAGPPPVCACMCVLQLCNCKMHQQIKLPDSGLNCAMDADGRRMLSLHFNSPNCSSAFKSAIGQRSSRSTKAWIQQTLTIHMRTHTHTRAHNVPNPEV